MFEKSKSEVIQKTADELKKQNLTKPKPWAAYVKTGANKERPPSNADWWYMRAASIMVTVQDLGPVGVSKLRTKYGGRKRRGHKPAEFRKAGGSIIRHILQDLEKSGLVKNNKDGKKGRVLTPKGISLLQKSVKVKKQ